MSIEGMAINIGTNIRNSRRAKTRNELDCIDQFFIKMGAKFGIEDLTRASCLDDEHGQPH